MTWRALSISPYDAGNTAATLGVNLRAVALPTNMTMPAAPGVTATVTSTVLATPTAIKVGRCRLNRRNPC